MIAETIALCNDLAHGSEIVTLRIVLLPIMLVFVQLVILHQKLRASLRIGLLSVVPAPLQDRQDLLGNDDTRGGVREPTIGFDQAGACFVGVVALSLGQGTAKVHAGSTFLSLAELVIDLGAKMSHTYINLGFGDSGSVFSLLDPLPLRRRDWLGSGGRAGTVDDTFVLLLGSSIDLSWEDRLSVWSGTFSARIDAARNLLGDPAETGMEEQQPSSVSVMEQSKRKTTSRTFGCLKLFVRSALTAIRSSQYQVTSCVVNRRCSLCSMRSTESWYPCFDCSLALYSSNWTKTH